MVKFVQHLLKLFIQYIPCFYPKWAHKATIHQNILEISPTEISEADFQENIVKI